MKGNILESKLMSKILALFVKKADIVNNLTTTASGSVLDARQGKTLKEAVDGKAASGHTHDDRYYTETEMDTLLADKFSISGGTMTGNIDMGKAGASSTAKIIQWTTTDGTVFQIRPYNNTFQIVRTPAGGTSSGVLNIDSGGNITVASPVSWRTALGVYGKSDVDGLVGEKLYSVRGTIVESGTTGTAKGYGKATIQIIGKTVLVDFSAKITTAGTVSDVYNVGISVATLRSINASIPAFTVGNGGNIIFFDADGKYSSMNGYAGEAGVNTSANYWSFARVYNTSGNVGAWADSNYQAGMVITGTLQGVLD